MSIRISAKALILHDGCLLLNRCAIDGMPYYALPGGGQRDGETIEEAVVRECMEETGYPVRPVRYVAVHEEIRVKDLSGPNAAYAHKLYHILRCEWTGAPRQTPTECDAHQLGWEWVPIAEAPTLPLYPAAVRERLPALLDADTPCFLPARRIAER